MKVSICVPAFERPDTVRQLVESVNRQEYPDLEIVVSDDSRNASVEEVVADACRVPYLYSRNRSRLGFAQNLRRALSISSGAMVIVLGDDDFLADSSSVQRYVNSALAYPSVGFSYSNLLQVGSSEDVTFVHRYFGDDRLFRSGSDAFEGLWLRSVQIAGMCFHMPGAEVAELFPSFDSLFPQVIAAGHVLADRDGYGHSGLLVGTRVSETQLGYQVAKGAERVSSRASLGGAELLDIVAELRAVYPIQLGGSVRRSLERQIVVGFVGSLPNIRLFCRRSDVWRMYKNYVSRTRLVLRAPWALAVLVGVISLPRPVIVWGVAVVKPLWFHWTAWRMGRRAG